MTKQFGNIDATLIDALNKRAGGRHLKERVVLNLKSLSEYRLHEVIHTLSARMRACSQGCIQAFGDARAEMTDHARNSNPARDCIAEMDCIRITVRVKPGASRARVGGSHGEPPALIVAVHAQPVDGQANVAVIGALAAALGLRTRELSVVGGHTHRTKTIEILTDDRDAVLARIADLLVA